MTVNEENKWSDSDRSQLLAVFREAMAEERAEHADLLKSIYSRLDSIDNRVARVEAQAGATYDATAALTGFVVQQSGQLSAVLIPVSELKLRVERSAREWNDSKAADATRLAKIESRLGALER